MRSQHTYDLFISGGGIPGLTLALMLGQKGVAVCIADPAPPPPPTDVTAGPRTSALMNDSIALLDACGVWDDCRHDAAALSTLRIIDDEGLGRDKLAVDFDAREIGLEQFGMNIPNAVLRAALAEHVRACPAVRFMEGSGLHHYETGAAAALITLDNGETVKAQLVVGADGRRSPVRGLAGIQCREHAYDQTAITALIEHDKAHDNISTEYHRPGGPFTMVPLPGNKSSVVWVETSEDAANLMRIKKTEFETALQDRSGGVLGQISLTGGPQSWPLMTLHAKTLTAPRVALVAEAAHVMSPLGAQGLNLSLRDVRILGHHLYETLKTGGDIGASATLQRYENDRRLDVGLRQAGVDGLNRLVANENGTLKGLRRLGLKALDRLHPLKTLVMQQGLAPKAPYTRDNCQSKRS